jgi:hypothetical protein
MNTDEDDEFNRIAHENEMKAGQPYIFDIYVSPSQRNVVLEEVAKEFDKMLGVNTAVSFASFVRNMKNDL